METIYNYLPHKFVEKIEQLPAHLLEKIEEIRLRINQPVEIIAGQSSYLLREVFLIADAQNFLNQISQFSLYTIEDELKNGYLTIKGGHRIGLAGRVILSNGEVKAIREISSFNIRIAREKIGVANNLIKFLYDGQWHDTIIIGPPQTGKTTLLRDLARIISTGSKLHNIKPLKVGIVDERSEIAGSVAGIPQLTFGARIDVLDSCPKATGMMMLIRSMSPDVIIVDEIGRQQDVEAIIEAANSGVKVMTTVHGNSLRDIENRPTIKRIIKQGVFRRFIELGRTSQPGTIINIKNEFGANVTNQVSVT